MIGFGSLCRLLYKTEMILVYDVGGMNGKRV